MKLNRILSASLFLATACSPGINENSSRDGGLEDINVPNGYSVSMVAGPDLVDFPMFATLDETGRLFVFESTGNVYEESQDAIENPQFRIKLLEDLNDDGFYDKSTIFADKVGFPQGGVFYQGSLYASSAPDLLKFTDTDGDGVADKREVILSGWVLNVNANSLIGPFMGPDGWLYMTSAIEGFDVTTLEGVRLKGETARIWRVRPDGSGLEWISAGGMNNPVELTFTEAGEPIGTETYFTNPKAGQRDALVYWTEGGVYPKPNNNIQHDELVRTGELMPVVSKYSRVSPAGIGRYRNTVFGNDFKDNLFSAQFNTHRIIRHQLIREGASFRTDDEVFFSSDNEDFHPTDVFEDADGSLLVVETGGWFIKGCPLSQVSKPELKGSIYRIRKDGQAKIDDPYGNEINWLSVNEDDVAKFFEDLRPFVRDRAQQWMVDHKAVNALRNLAKNSSINDGRTKAVFALYRIGSPQALEIVRSTLQNPDLQVRIAAARAAGLAKDVGALDNLVALMKDGEPAVRRQAATALGQIGGAKAIPALLAAAETETDRFIQHAIIYSLISINQPAEVMPALESASPDIRRTALIALDQMPSSKLRSDQVITFLESKDATIQRTGLWVTSLHPEWSEEMNRYLKNRLQQNAGANEEKALLSEIMVSFCGNASTQKFMADQLLRGPAQQKVILLKAMSECQQKEFPKVWIKALDRIVLYENDPQVQSSALELIHLRGLNSMTASLEQLAENKNKPVMLRLEALAALSESRNVFKDVHFRWLLEQLDNKNEAPIRLKAAAVMAQSSLTEKQIHHLATDYLPTADAFILSRLVSVFKGAYSSEIGNAVLNALLNSDVLDGYTEENILSVFAQYPDDMKANVDKLITKLKAAHGDRLERIQKMESRIEDGVLENGRRLFFGKAVCSTCHTIGAEGGTLGPDLTSIQRDRSAHDLLEAIVYPSLSYVREYETYQIKTHDEEYTGIIQQQTAGEVVVSTAPETSVRIPRSKILSMTISDVSLMPQGLDMLLTEQEMADLMAFMLAQDQDPERDEHILR